MYLFLQGAIIRILYAASSAILPANPHKSRDPGARLQPPHNAYEEVFSLAGTHLNMR
jgi:hypothetical protein